MKPKKILFVSHTSGLYGAERSLLTLVLGLQKFNDISPIVLLPRKGPLADLLRDKGTRVIIRPYFHWIGKNRINRLLLGPVRLILNLVSLALIYHLINQIKPDVIYTNTLSNPFGALISVVFKTPHVWHAREIVNEGIARDYDFGRKLSMGLVSKSSKVICNSHAVKNKLERVVKKNIFKVVYNGFNFDAFQFNELSDRFDRCVSTARPIKLLISGQVHPGKGHEDALRALAVLDSQGFPVGLSIVGSGKKPYMAFLSKLSKKLSVEDKVVWHGFVDNPLIYIADAAVVLVCSRCEAFGRGAVEAMAAGVPVVGTRNGGLPEIIENRVTGLLYDPGDYKALAGQIALLLTERELYEQIANRGQQSVVSRFAVEKYTSEVKNIITKVCLQEYKSP